MTMGADWLPPLLRLEDFGGDWSRYVEAAFALFHRDFIASQPRLHGCWVRCRRDPMSDGKEAGFWHCVSEGHDEAARTPDLRRCERIEWVRAVIEHMRDGRVQTWFTQRGKDRRCVLWFEESYVVIVAERLRRRDGCRYWQLVTAYCTDREHTQRKLRKDRDRSPPNG